MRYVGKVLLVLTVPPACAVAGCVGTESMPTGSTSSMSTSQDMTQSPSSEASGVVTTVTTQPPMVRALAGAAFTDSWGCGYGFAITNDERSVAIRLTTVQPVPVGTSAVDLPDVAWRAEVDFGENLLDVDCQDLDYAFPSEPTDTWPIVGGRVRITAPQPYGCSTPESAVAVVEGLTVATPDGTVVTLPELTILNDQWGCSAG